MNRAQGARLFSPIEFLLVLLPIVAMVAAQAFGQTTTTRTTDIAHLYRAATRLVR
jgi:hypothetical protein